jgi:DNA invertase Pin-like site-specific DNA recombinase
MRRYSNPPGTPGGLGELLTSPTRRNTIEREGLPPAQRQRRLRQDEVSLLVEDYCRGASVEELILAYGVNRTTVYGHLDRNGIERPRGIGRLSAEQVHHAARLHKSGHPVSAIALRFGVGEETVRRALRRIGVQLRRG